MAGVGVPDSLPTTVTGSDGITRCSWATEIGLDLQVFHDTEWGRPTRNARDLFEVLTLTYFEGGLSWTTVFNKRDAFRRAFEGFDPDQVTAMTPSDVDRLVADPSIIRNRAKIDATVHNAHLVSAAPTLAEITWAHRPPARRPLRSWSDGRMRSPESEQLSDALKERGYRLVGPVVANSYMHAVGVVNGHFDGCFRAP